MLKQTALIVLLILLNSSFVEAYDWTQDADAEATWLLDVSDNPTPDATASFDGTVTGATHATASPAKSYSTGYYTFDGSNDEINFGDIPAIDDSSIVSGVAWVYQNNITQDHWIFGHYNGTSGLFWMFDDTSAGSGRTDIYRIFTRESAGAGQGLVNLETPTSGATAGDWEHVAFSWQANVSSGLRLWVDGIEVADSPVSTVGNNDFGLTSADFRAGETNTGVSDRNGRQDELGVFTVILDGTDINDIMTNGLLQAVVTSRRIMIIN